MIEREGVAPASMHLNSGVARATSPSSTEQRGVIIYHIVPYHPPSTPLWLNVEDSTQTQTVALVLAITIWVWSFGRGLFMVRARIMEGRPGTLMGGCISCLSRLAHGRWEVRILQVTPLFAPLRAKTLSVSCYIPARDAAFRELVYSLLSKSV